MDFFRFDVSFTLLTLTSRSQRENRFICLGFGTVPPTTYTRAVRIDNAKIVFWTLDFPSRSGHSQFALIHTTTRLHTRRYSIPQLDR